MVHDPLIDKIRHIRKGLEEARRRKFQVEHVATQVKLYRQKEQEGVPYSALQAAVEDRFGMDAIPPELADSNNLIAKQVLKELLKRGHESAQAENMHGASELTTIIARLHEDPDLHVLEKELHDSLAELRHRHRTAPSHCQRLNGKELASKPSKKAHQPRWQGRVEEDEEKGWLHDVVGCCHF